jgi:methylmalonyl-CoA mutase C-terminal domain/subunit
MIEPSRNLSGSREQPGKVIRILLAEVGPGNHDRDVKLVARILRDAGMDVIYTGTHYTYEEVVAAAIQEDADILCISLLSGAPMTVFSHVIELLEQGGAQDILLVGSNVADDKIAEMKRLGAAAVLGPGMPPEKIVGRLRELVTRRGRR